MNQLSALISAAYRRRPLLWAAQVWGLLTGPIQRARDERVAEEYEQIAREMERIEQLRGTAPLIRELADARRGRL